MRYYFEAYGCTMNQGETRMLAEEMNRHGHIEVDSPEKADIALIGTCIVISKTEERMKRRIKELSEICSKVKVTGCLTTTRKNELMDISDNIEKVVPNDVALSIHPEPSLIGVIPIATGCYGECSYCVTKLARGNLKSRDPEDIKCRFEKLLDSSAWEIQLTCQDTASYGEDINYSFPELVYKLLEIDEDYRVRIGMMNPDTAMPIKEEIKNILNDNRIYKFLHIPLQSGSESVLRDMNRKYTPEDWIKLITEFRQEFPDLTLSTDIITGFPGETNDDFDKTLDILKESIPDIINVTRFSPRPGTEAMDRPNKVHSRIKKDRSRELTDLRFKISRERNERYVGRCMQATILEEGKGDSLKGRTDNYKVVVLNKNDSSLIGKRVEVDIIDAEDVYLEAELNRAI
ncbi:MAG: tRNA (N(6)-L-threonylcarbamoyladenosine(37)-C(2))-methylthiotransferase [Candidatus Saliniplasma sp.]